MDIRFVVSTKTDQGRRRGTLAIGPRDKRLRKSRCTHCARAHRKCSGDAVCSNCTRLGLECVYAKSPHAIDRKGDDDGRVNLRIPMLPDTLQNLSFIAVNHFFQYFLSANNFSSQQSTYMYDVHLYNQSCQQVYHATTAVGALSLRRRSSTEGSKWSRLAYESYADSLKALRSHLQIEKSPANLLQDLWAILLLGIFEMMEDSTGQGFLQHMNSGVTKVLEQLGPAFFRHGLARRFFLEIRLLEVCKSILLSRPSLFAQQEWRELAECTWVGEDVEAREPVEDLLGTMVCISDFVTRAIEAAETASSQTSTPISTLEWLSHEAHELIERLQTWLSNAARHHCASPKDDTTLLSSTYHSACSIYLSSPFDYFTIWQASDIATPSLSQPAVKEHVETIISSVKQLLEARKVAGVLLLFPLRIAGSRCRFDASPVRRKQIEELLGQITKTYAVAEAVEKDLNGLWGSHFVRHHTNNNP